MAASIKTISDAIITRLAAGVPSLDERRVAAFSGSAAELVRQGRNLPFVGIGLGSVSYAALNADDSLARESLTFSLIAVVEDFRGRGFSLETGYGLLDETRDCLMGAKLGIDGLAPLELAGFSLDSAAERDGMAVFDASLRTWQVRQRL